MWETYGLQNESLLWSGIAFTGGIGGQQQAPCGALSASAICLGLRHGTFATDKQKAKQARLKAREQAAELIEEFKRKFDAITCLQLTGTDFSNPGGYQRFLESGVSAEKCDRYVQFIIEKLYELDDKISSAQIPQDVTIYTKPGCPFCAAAKQDLDERGVNYTELSIADNPKVAEEVRRLSNGEGIVPILLVDGKVTVGYGGG